MHEVGSDLDMRRVHFVGKVPYQTYLDVLHVSSVHAYWTTPFVLSWSFLEAAMSGLLVVAGDTAPVREFASELGVTAVDFFNRGRFADALVERLGVGAVRRNVFYHQKLGIEYCIAMQKKMIFNQIESDGCVNVHA